MKNKPLKKEKNSSTFWTIAAIIFLRIFIVEPFRIPSESMVPTLLIGDHLFVAKSAYDINLGVPFTSINKSIVKISDPKRGDVLVFKRPDPTGKARMGGKNFIKRVMAIPGDRVSVSEGRPIINGKHFSKVEVNYENFKERLPAYKHSSYSNIYEEEIPDARHNPHWMRREGLDDYKEHLPALKARYESYFNKDCVPMGRAEFLRSDSNLSGVEKSLQYSIATSETCEFVVPDGHYFVMGDNRDNSSDGRIFGLVPRNLVKGRALFIWLSVPQKYDGQLMKENPLKVMLVDFIPGLFRMLKNKDYRDRIGRVIR